MKYLAILLILILFTACEYVNFAQDEQTNTTTEDTAENLNNNVQEEEIVETPEQLQSSCLVYANLLLPETLQLQALDPQLNYFALPGYYGNPAPLEFAQFYNDNVPMRVDYMESAEGGNIFHNIAPNKYQNDNQVYTGYLLHNGKFRKLTFSFEITASLTDDVRYENKGTCAYKQSNERYGCFVGYIGDFKVVDTKITDCQITNDLPRDLSYGDELNFEFDSLRAKNDFYLSSYWQLAGLEQWFYNQRADYKDSRWQGFKSINAHPTFISAYQIGSIINPELRQCRVMYYDLITGEGNIKEESCSKHYGFKKYDRFGEVVTN